MGSATWGFVAYPAGADPVGKIHPAPLVAPSQGRSGGDGPFPQVAAEFLGVAPALREVDPTPWEKTSRGRVSDARFSPICGHSKTSANVCQTAEKTEMHRR